MATAAQLSKSEKYRNVAQRVKESIIGAGEPQIHPDTYKIDLIRAFNYYSIYEDPKKIRKWALGLIDKDPVKIKKIENAPDIEVKYLGIIARLHERGQYLAQAEIDNVKARLDSILNRPLKEEKDETIKQKTSAVLPSQKRDEVYHTILGTIEGEIDEFIISNFTTSFDPKKFLTDQKVSSAYSKKIASWLQDTYINEFNEAYLGVNKDLNEAYSHIPKTKLKKLISFVHEIIAACTQMQVVKIRKPRKVKVKSPAELVKKMKYLPEFAELNLTSVHPTKLIKAQEAWIYDTKTRKLCVYRQFDSDGLTVKGNAIVNFNTSSSEVRILRKPEEWFKIPKTKREYASAWKSLTTKVSIPNGRMNPNMIIVAVF